MLQKIVNIGVNSLKRRNFGVMANKILLRLKEQKSGDSQADILTWCQSHAESAELFAQNLDAALWEETQSICADIDKKAHEKLRQIDLDLGGGGHYPLLYFLTRYLKASCVVETGVAAGWSSYAILTALEKNAAGGKLYSSDFPYFRYKNPEKLVGYVVDEALKKNWDLYIDGDRNNLPLIVNKVSSISLFHYDSDKSYNGRVYALETVKRKLSEKAVIMFDDIQDNTHFKELIETTQKPFKIFEFGGKYLGMTGQFLEGR